MMKLPKIAVLTFICCVISSPFAGALSVKALDLKQIVALSDVIFKGTLLETKVAEDPYESGHLVAYHTFRVEDCLKGSCGEAYTFKQLAQGPAGIPEYKTGKTYLIFLPEGTEKTGLVAPVGIWQGLYGLEKRGERWVVPGLSKNSRMVKTLGKATDDYNAFRSAIVDLVKEEK